MMRSGAEIKVGIITVVAIGLLAAYFFFVRGYQVATSTYGVCIIFDDARGLQHGDPVLMVGVKIGEVDVVEIKDLKAQVSLKINRKYDLYDDYKFQIATSGLIQERFVDVVPSPPNPYANKLKENACIKGVLQPSLGDLVAKGATVLENLDRMSRGVNVLLSNEELLGRVQKALESFSAAAQAATDLAESTAALAEQSQPQIIATLEQMQATASDMRGITSRMRAEVERGPVLGDLEQTMKSARATAANAERISASLAEFATNRQTQLEIKQTVDAIHDAALSIKEIGEDLQAFSAELRKAAPIVPKATHEAEQYIGTAQVIRERLKPPQINASFDMLYGSQANRWISSGRVDISTQPDRFFRIGVDDIGEESNATVQVGERHGPRVLRYGLYRSRLGAGMDVNVSRRTVLSLDMFDPNDFRIDVLADIPLIQGRSDLSAILGARDLGHDSTIVGGLRVKR